MQFIVTTGRFDPGNWRVMDSVMKCHINSLKIRYVGALDTVVTLAMNVAAMFKATSNSGSNYKTFFPLWVTGRQKQNAKKPQEITTMP